MRIGILASHPIQYHAPWFRGLAKAIDLRVFFAHRPSAQEQAAGFGGAFEWDVDLLWGYQHTFLENKARRPGVNHFLGCDTPEIAEIIASHRSQVTGHEKFDAFIVCGWNLKCYWQAIRACRRIGIPIFVRGDSQLYTSRSLLKRTLKEVTHRLALRQFDGFLSPGQRNRNYLLHYGVPEQKIFFVPHFVDNEFFREKAEKLNSRKAEIRRDWRIAEDAFVPLFVGKFISKKRPLDLIKAAQLLLRSRPELKLHLLFVGSGELGDDLRAACNVVFDGERSNLSHVTYHSSLPNASFIGFLNQTQLSRAYVAADVVVLPSESETWGLAVNEAMASGLPAIASDAVGCEPDLIDQGETGFAFPTRHVERLQERLEALIEMKLRKHDFCAALTTKLRRYSVEAAVGETVNAIQRIRG